ncbi:MAG: 3-methyl-2-oxobutanoate hydroxymethyltransferase [Actinomycetota bacterium]|nr:3-methyl-2-oxobutanoate hydroxymethyltransferase [Actinomycetota bacterium]
MTSPHAQSFLSRTIPELRRYKAGEGQQPLVMVTAYDAPTARFAVEAGVDILLVGDSVGTTLLGYDSTVPVTIDDILHHTRAVRRGAPGAHIVADLPFMTYQVSDEQAVANAGRLLKEGGADAVKLEGGLALASRVEAIARAGIPVVGHIGLTPQTAGLLGGFKVQGQEFISARALIDDAIAVARAGAYMLVIEVVPSALTKLIAERVSIPVIGIGAGADCDGQVLVMHDLLGIEDRHAARFVKRYATLAADIRAAVTAFASDVRDGAYPQPEHTYKMKSTVLAELRDSLEREPS